MGQFAAGLPERIKKDFTNTLKLLRNQEFQDLLVNYQRAKRSFLVAYETEDEVSSARQNFFGVHEKPEDYLKSFSIFVKEKTDQITAIKILLDRPKQWNPAALDELRQKLKENCYDEKTLSEAHKIVYRKALADIISMFKHAARDAEPILTAEERVDRAIQKISINRVFSEEQKKWLSLIREHLIKNLTIEEEDFDVVALFEQLGGKGKARKVFGNDLTSIIEALNLSIAA